MDARHFDHLARMVSRVNARRGVLRLLTALPVLAGLAALLDPGESDAAGRRKRRKKRHKHAQNERKGRRRRRHGKCKAKSRARTCAGTCGIVKNRCKKTVDCGSCACTPSCAVCQICDPVTASCLPDPAQQGSPCGEPGQVCQADGACACDGGSCPACRTCGGDGL